MKPLQETADLDGDGEITPSIPGDAGPDTATWQEALRYSSDLELAGHADWRLPTVRELESIADYVARWPGAAVDPWEAPTERRPPEEAISLSAVKLSALDILPYSIYGFMDENHARDR